MNQNINKIQIGDSINDLVVSSFSEKSCKFTNTLDNSVKTMRWTTVNKMLLTDWKSLKSRTNKDIFVDFTNKKTVLDYFNSFNKWAIALRMINIGTQIIVDVCDNVLLYNGIYYVAGPKGYGDKQEIPNGLYCVRVYELKSQTYNAINNVYVFEVIEKVTLEQIKDANYRNTRSYRDMSDGELFEYFNSIDLFKVSGRELDFIKSNMILFFDKYLPYTAKNGVVINKWLNFKSPLVCNRSGLIYIDNTGGPSKWSELQYGLTIRFNPSFSNESCYSQSISINSLGPEALEAAANVIQKSCDLYKAKALS